MRRVIRDSGFAINRDDILEIFFGAKQGDLPENLKDLQAEYLQKMQEGGGCSSCKANSIRRYFKREVLNRL